MSRTLVAGVVLSMGTALVSASGYPPTGSHLQPSSSRGNLTQAQKDIVPPPPGTRRVVSSDRHAERIAACAERSGPPLERGGHRFLPTDVWITDGRDVWKTRVPGACDPAWSPDGQRLAVAAPDGIWILSGSQQQNGDRFTDVREREAADAAGATFMRPRWSRDARRLAALVSKGGSTWVEVMDVATGKLLFKSPPGVSDFIWGADANTLEIDGAAISILKTIKR